MTKDTVITRPMTSHEMTTALGAITGAVAKRSYKPLTILGFILVIAKLFALPTIVDVSWWLVLLPFYIVPATIIGVVLVIAAICGGGILLLLAATWVIDKIVAWRSKRHLARLDTLRDAVLKNLRSKTGNNSGRF